MNLKSDKPFALNTSLYVLAGLAAIIIVGGYLRFHGLGAESLWNDEVGAWRQSAVNSMYWVLQNVVMDTRPPAFQFFLYYWMKIAGDSEAALRFPSAVAGVLTILTVFLIGRRIYSKKEGLIAAAVMAVSWSAIYYSQEARSYSFVLLSASAALYFWFGIIKGFSRDESPPKRVLAGYIVFAIATIYLHYFGLVLIILQGCYVLLLCLIRRKMYRSWLLVYGLIFVAYLAWIPGMIFQFNSRSEFWIPDPQFFNIIYDISRLAYLMPAGIHVPLIGSGAIPEYAWLIVLVLPAYFMVFICSAIKLTTESRAGARLSGLMAAPEALLAYCIVGPFLVTFVQSKLLMPLLTPKYLITFLAPAYLLLARGIGLIRPKYLSTAWAVFLCAFILYSTVGDHNYYGVIKKEQFREAAQYLVANDPPGNRMPVIAFTWNYRYYNYYFRQLGSGQRVRLLAGKAEDIEVVKRFLSANPQDEFWLITGQRVPDKEFLDYLEKHYNMLDHKVFKSTSVRRYGKK